MSKLRYGLQLCNQVRTTQEDPINANMKSVQAAQKKLLRVLDRVTLKDHITSNSLLLKYNLPSVNQLAAEIKLTEAWKTNFLSFLIYLNFKCNHYSFQNSVPLMSS